jgi:hypothetical protein
MVYLLARLAEHARAGSAPTLRLPRSEEQVAVLKKWQFEPATEQVTGYALRKYLDADSLDVLNRANPGVDRLLNESLPRAYYPLRCAFRATGDLNVRLAARLAKEWQSPFILSVLDRMLDGQGRIIATHLIYELVMNSVRHPDANVLLMGASTALSSDGQHNLLITVWDDGESIIDNLREVSKITKGYVPRKNPMFARTLHYQSSEYSPQNRVRSESPTRQISNQEPLDADAADDLVLLASTFPGITRDVDRKLGFRPYSEREAPELLLSGMGLYIMSTAATEIFGGDVTIRTKNVALSLTAGGHPKELHAKAESITGNHANIVGNQVTIKIPIRVAH